MNLCPSIGQLYDYAKDRCKDYPMSVREVVDLHTRKCEKCQQSIKELKELTSLKSKERRHTDAQAFLQSIADQLQTKSLVQIIKEESTKPGVVIRKGFTSMIYIIYLDKSAAKLALSLSDHDEIEEKDVL